MEDATSAEKAVMSEGDTPTFCILPRRVQIEVTTRCNLRCPMCTHRTLAVHRDMTHSDFAVIASRVCHEGTERVILNGVGEPLLNPNIAKMVALCRSLSVPRVEIYTNGHMLTRERLREFADAGLTHLIVSIDGATQAAYKRVRQGGDYAAVWRNVKTAMESSAINTRIQYVLSDLNVADLPHLAQRAYEHGVLEIVVVRELAFVDWSSQSSFRTVRVGCQNPIPELDESVARFKAACAKLGVKYRVRANESHTDCVHPFRDIYITVDGRVTPCCRIQAGVYTGNVLSAKLECVWNGVALRRWRKLLLQGEPPPVCRRVCGSIRVSTERCAPFLTGGLLQCNDQP